MGVRRAIGMASHNRQHFPRWSVNGHRVGHRFDPDEMIGAVVARGKDAAIVLFGLCWILNVIIPFCVIGPNINSRA